MLLRKKTGGCTIGAYEWPEDGSVAEVSYEDGLALLAIPGNDFSVADPAEAADTPASDEATDAGEPAGADAPASDVTEEAPGDPAPAEAAGEVSDDETPATEDIVTGAADDKPHAETAAG